MRAEKIKIKNKLSDRQLQILRYKERSKYNKWYFENVYWIEDFPNKKHYQKFNYNDPTHKKRFLYLTNILVKYFKFKTILDAGCGMGQVTRNFLKIGYKVKGVEASKDAVKYYMLDLVKRGIVRNVGLEKLPFKSNQFDLVFCSDVMEHIPMFDVLESIKELTRTAKKFLVLTINLDHSCEYHPTMLSREKWVELFLASGKLEHIKSLEQRIEKETKKRYKEYDWFIFQKKL